MERNFQKLENILKTLLNPDTRTWTLLLNLFRQMKFQVIQKRTKKQVR